MIQDFQITGAVDRLKTSLSETPARRTVELNEALDRWLIATEIAVIDVKMAHQRYCIDRASDADKMAREELEYLQTRRRELMGDS